jgi:acetoin utilization deacetylase AcuC-like enzyme
MAGPTALVWSELYLWHDPGRMGPSGCDDRTVEPGEALEESPAPIRRLRNLLEVSGLFGHLDVMAPRAAGVDALGLVHATRYLEHVQRCSVDGQGWAGEVTPVGRDGFRFAALSAGGCMTAVDAVLEGRARNAYALVRPAGHHALPDSGRGNCIFNNVAIAARHAQRSHGVRRIAILDWDAHHGNGTQAVFWEDPDVLTISLHQADWYPRGEGGGGERGGGAGLGANLNIPLPPGSGEGAYAAALDRVAAPAIRAHAPDLILVSCGFDASAADPSARMLLTARDFARMTETASALADELCEGRLVLCQEGGYSAVYTPFCGLATLEALSGHRTGAGDPFHERYAGVGHSSLQPDQDAVIEAAARAAA